MKFILALLLVAGCSETIKVDRAKLLQNAEAFCACHKGLWYLENYQSLKTIGIKCNDGIYTSLNYDSLVFNNCPEK